MVYLGYVCEMCEKSKSVGGNVNSAFKGKSLNFKIQGEKNEIS